MKVAERDASLVLLALALLLTTSPAQAIKFHLPAYRNPEAKCIYNPVHDGDLVIVTAIVDYPSSDARKDDQRVDIEIIDSSSSKNVYLSKRDLNGETRLAITSHAEGDVGVCFKNWLDWNIGEKDGKDMTRIVDLDVDVGADAVDYNAIANQESLSALETEMRKLEGQIEAIVEEFGYLKTREERFSITNESTNKRVQNFAWFTICLLMVVGAWQIFHLRAFFKRKYLID